MRYGTEPRSLPAGFEGPVIGPAPKAVLKEAIYPEVTRRVALKNALRISLISLTTGGNRGA